LAALVLPDGRRFSIEYGAWGNPTRVTTPDGAVREFDYGDASSFSHRPPGNPTCPNAWDALRRRRVVRERVLRAREAQVDRQGKPNARLDPDEIDRHCLPDCAGAQLLKQAMSRLDLSARAYHRILKVARTVADLAGAAHIGGPHVAEAIHYRRGFQ
jgi:YD repeat-containing protein